MWVLQTELLGGSVSLCLTWKKILGCFACQYSFILGVVQEKSQNRICVWGGGVLLLQLVLSTTSFLSQDLLD